jgi:hypothetical protein
MQSVRALANSKPLSGKSAAAAKGYAKSRVSNGRDILPRYVDGQRLDQRSLLARRYRDISEAIVADQAGADQCSEARLQLIRRFAAASVLAEQMESRLANGQQISITEHALLCSTLTRIASRLGLERRSRNITPSLEQYLVEHSPAPREAAE